MAAGDSLLSPSVTRHLIEEFVRRPDATRPVPPSLDGLTEREAQVLTLVARLIRPTHDEPRSRT